MCLWNFLPSKGSHTALINWNQNHFIVIIKVFFLQINNPLRQNLGSLFHFSQTLSQHFRHDRLLVVLFPVLRSQLWQKECHVQTWVVSSKAGKYHVNNQRKWTHLHHSMHSMILIGVFGGCNKTDRQSFYELEHASFSGMFVLWLLLVGVIVLVVCICICIRIGNGIGIRRFQTFSQNVLHCWCI